MGISTKPTNEPDKHHHHHGHDNPQEDQRVGGFKFLFDHPFHKYVAHCLRFHPFTAGWGAPARVSFFVEKHSMGCIIPQNPAGFNKTFVNGGRIRPSPFPRKIDFPLEPAWVLCYNTPRKNKRADERKYPRPALQRSGVTGCKRRPGQRGEVPFGAAALNGYIAKPTRRRRQAPLQAAKRAGCPTPWGVLLNLGGTAKKSLRPFCWGRSFFVPKRHRKLLF